jgi:hypothetical protein
LLLAILSFVLGRPLCPHPCGQTRSAVNDSSIFPPGAGIVKGVAKNALYTFTEIGVSEKLWI